MKNVCEHRPEISKIIFGNERLNVPQSLGKSYNTMYHGSKYELTKEFSKYSINKVIKNAEKSAIIIEMSPLIRAKCSQKADMACFSDLANILSYKIMRLGFDYSRIDIVFDRYFGDSLKEGPKKAETLGHYRCLIIILIFHRI